MKSACCYQGKWENERIWKMKNSKYPLQQLSSFSLSLYFKLANNSWTERAKRSQMKSTFTKSMVSDRYEPSL